MQNASPAKPIPLLIDVSEAGRLLGMTPHRVTRLAKAGLLPCVALPDGELRYLPDDLRAWVERHRRPAAEEGNRDE